MFKPVYSAIDAAGAVIEPGEHKAVRVEHPLLAQPIIVTAHRSEKRLTHAEAVAWAESLDINDWKWRLPTAEEAFLICDRTLECPALPKEFFPDCEGEWIWTSTPPAWNLDAAWFVSLGSGVSYWSSRNGGSRVRAVRAGQSPGLSEDEPMLSGAEIDAKKKEIEG